VLFLILRKQKFVFLNLRLKKLMSAYGKQTSLKDPIYDHYIAIDWSIENMTIARMTKKSNMIKVFDVPSDIGKIEQGISPRVSGDLKDGLFGAAGGIIFGV
jgi:hypothetical protein